LDSRWIEPEQPSLGLPFFRQGADHLLLHSASGYAAVERAAAGARGAHDTPPALQPQHAQHCARALHLPQLRCPVVLIHGTADDTVPPHISLDIAAALQPGWAPRGACAHAPHAETGMEAMQAVCGLGPVQAVQLQVPGEGEGQPGCECRWWEGRFVPAGGGHVGQLCLVQGGDHRLSSDAELRLMTNKLTELCHTAAARVPLPAGAD
jgi:hypothetical protein